MRGTEQQILLTPRELAALRECVEGTIARMEMEGVSPSEYQAALRRALIKLRRDDG